DKHLDIQRIVFGEKSNAALGVSPRLIQGHAIQPYVPGIGLEVLGDHAHGGGLSGAVGPQKTHHLAAVHREGDVVYGGYTIEALGHALEGKKRHSQSMRRRIGSSRRFKKVARQLQGAWISVA